MNSPIKAAPTRGILGKILLFAVLVPTVRCQHLPTSGVDRQVGRIFMEGLTGRNFAQVKMNASQGRIGAVVIFASAFRDAEDLKTKVKAIRSVSVLPLIFAIDGEGGKVLRLPGQENASAVEMGRQGSQWTTEQAAQIAKALHALGIDLNLAPVVDIASNPNNPIAQSGRCFSDDPLVVSARALDFIAAHSRVGVLTTLKHFPGHGSSSGDTHQGWVDMSASWSESDLIPYRKIFATKFKGAVMVGHVFVQRLDPDFPASLSQLTVQGLLRNTLGFQGVVITDDLQMGAVTKTYSFRRSVQLALEAGNDFLLVGQQYRQDDLEATEAWLSEEIRAGRISLQRVQQANARIESLSLNGEQRALGQ